MERSSRIEQAFWSAMLGAVWNVGLCSLVDLMTWKLRYFSLEVGVVWTGSLETMLWRGALVGAVTGWWLGSGRAMVLASAAGGLLLAVLHMLWRTLFQYTHLRYAIDLGVTVHFLINGLVVGVVAGVLTRHAFTDSRKQKTEAQ